jgi:hypothetical protein
LLNKISVYTFLSLPEMIVFLLAASFSVASRFKLLNDDTAGNVVVYLSPSDRFSFLIAYTAERLSPEQLAEYDRLMASLAIKGGFANPDQTAEDLWYFNQPEFEEVFSLEHFPTDSAIRVIREYEACLPYGKYLPRGLRSDPVALETASSFFGPNGELRVKLKPRCAAYLDDMEHISGEITDCGYSHLLVRDDGLPISLKVDLKHFLPFARMLITEEQDGSIEIWHADSLVPFVYTPSTDPDSTHLRTTLLVPIYSPDLEVLQISLNIWTRQSDHPRQELFLYPTNFRHKQAVVELDANTARILLNSRGGLREVAEGYPDRSPAQRDADLVAMFRETISEMYEAGKLPFKSVYPQQRLLQSVIDSIAASDAIVLSLIRSFLSGRCYSFSTVVSGSRRDNRSQVVITIEATIEGGAMYRYSPMLFWDRFRVGPAAERPPVRSS